MMKQIINLQKKFTFIALKDKSSKLNLFFVASFFLFIYFFIAFLPLPWAIKTGLDESWSYAISEAAQKQSIFGQDIIFTYGPLGYLIAGATLDQNFLQIILFRWSIYLLLFITSTLRIINLKNLTHQLFVGLSIILALFIGTPYIGVGMSTDYQILFIFLIILSFDKFTKKNIYKLSILLGAASGFFALTKLTLGIYTLGSLIIFLLVNFYQSYRKKSKTELITYFFAILNSCLTFISVAFIFLEPDKFLLNLSKIIVNFVIAVIVAVLVRFLLNRIDKQVELDDKISPNFFVFFKYNRRFSELIFYVTYSLLIAYLISSNLSSSLVDYLKNSWEITSGYSSAMSVTAIGSRLPSALAISSLFLIIWLTFTIAKKDTQEKSFSFPLIFALFFVLLLSFKHSFVRKDAHILVFSILVPFITSLVVLTISRFRNQKIYYYFFAYSLITSVIIFLYAVSFLHSLPPDYRINILDIQSKKLMPNQVIKNLNFLRDPKKLQSEIQKETINNLSQIHLPENVKNLVKKKPIDIIPWEVSLAPANNLNWQPRPIFQSYSAYTDKLDEINFSSLSTNNSDYLFYNFQSIDQRHPFFDEPKTFFYVFCNYKPSSEIPDFIKTPKLSNIILLEKLKKNRCSSTSLGKTASVLWNNLYSIESNDSDGMITRANVKFQYSLFGKIYKLLFKIPPVVVNVDYLDGSKKIYRIIPENSGNGVIVSHLPREDNEAMSFFRGQLLARVKSFSFQTTNSLLYIPNIEISFSSNSLPY